ncbi:glycosyltransferase WbsX family protein [Coleofasciculus sp. G2-EDA-02]|uniref:glycosyltransferase WbsX family protein n=1 Tax=Coleofasciculus sp. G2-EDA-02 TaxID=3069529 RepID=UPI004062CFAC
MKTNELDSRSPQARLIAFYLPQFHPIPENDDWWGKGFTEWTNVAKAKPLFFGHYQPRLPADLGYYDLRVPETRIAQAELAKQHGIEGFCYWHYWFAGRRLLERPFTEILKLKKPDFPFCLAWANQSWSGIWHGCPDRILVQQTYPGIEDYKAHFYAVLNAFGDSRYITVEDKPLFVVYNPHALPEPKQFIDCWQNLAVKSGLKGLYFVGITKNPQWNPELDGFDAFTVSNPDYIFNQRSPRIFLKKSIIEKLSKKSLQLVSKKIYDNKYPPLPTLFSYEKAIKNAFITNNIESENYPCVFPNWDNTPRSGVNGKVFLDSTPDLFRVHLREALEQVASKDLEKRIIFIKSWNEWAEGNYLEPDIKFGKGYLQVIRDEIYNPT